MEQYKTLNIGIHSVEINGATGDIEFEQDYDECNTVDLALSELKQLVEEVEKHKTEYNAYIVSEREGYAVPKISDKVKVNVGRNKGLYGKVTTVKEAQAMIDFGRDITTTDGFKTPDRYWVHIKNLEIKE